MNEATRTACAVATLEEIVHRLKLDPDWQISGMGAAECRARLPNDIAVRITIGIEESNDERLSVMQAAVAHKDCPRP